VRVIAATHRPLREMVRESQFRQDLYYRLSVFEVNLPSLRERSEDIPLLVEDFLERAGKKGHAVTPEALKKLGAHRWEGNVRELKNVIERALVYAGDGAIEAGHLTLDSSTATPAGVRRDILSGEKSLEEVEAEVILATLKKTSWNKTQAAKILGITRRTLLDKIARYNLTQS
jgi:DNA-binding NtrC family response regulator